MRSCPALPTIKTKGNPLAPQVNIEVDTNKKTRSEVVDTTRSRRSPATQPQAFAKSSLLPSMVARESMQATPQSTAKFAKTSVLPWMMHGDPMKSTAKNSFSSTSPTPFHKAVTPPSWESETQRRLHENRQRLWLRGRWKTNFIDFSDTERAELRQYFNALADNTTRIRSDQLEDMLISLGLVDNREDVTNFVNRLDADRSGELDFDEYLTMVQTRNENSAIVQVFRAMMEGKLGDRNLHFPNVISTYRRQLMLDATGMRGVGGKKVERGLRILRNFHDLEKSRVEEALKNGTVHPSAAALAESERGSAPLGGLGMMWSHVCSEHQLATSRPASADRRMGKHRVETPLSPRSILRATLKKSRAVTGGKQRHVVRSESILSP